MILKMVVSGKQLATLAAFLVSEKNQVPCPENFRWIERIEFGKSYASTVPFATLRTSKTMGNMGPEADLHCIVVEITTSWVGTVYISSPMNTKGEALYQFPQRPLLDFFAALDMFPDAQELVRVDET